VHLGQVRWVPGDGADGDRRREGVKRMQAVARNCRKQDRLVGARKARNGAGAKGSGQAVA